MLLALAAPAVAAAWTWPAPGPVLQGFAFSADDPLAPGQHRGIDIEGPLGGQVLAPSAGTVSFVGRVAANGLTITIETVDGYAITLLHLGSFLVVKGAIVTEGQPVALVGTSGLVAHPVPYVQLGIRVLGDEQGYLDPQLFLPPLAAPPAPEPTPEPAPDPGPVPAPSQPPAPAVQPAPPPPVPTTPIAAPPARIAEPVAPSEPRPAPVLPTPALPETTERPAFEPEPQLPASPRTSTHPQLPVATSPLPATPAPFVAPRPALSRPVARPTSPTWLRDPDPQPVFADAPRAHRFPWSVLALGALALLAARRDRDPGRARGRSYHGHRCATS